MAGSDADLNLGSQQPVSPAGFNTHARSNLATNLAHVDRLIPAMTLDILNIEQFSLYGGNIYL
ncbi:hypothetical protein [Chamaesiphon sp. OTE_75_metabat_556]|uniref:hypothetical protein n=1 Tax=Chamaesiphon sp. OTE_75_metabat_556 TaxID=2964692 RepID=UPI00286B7C58|nr:hypothetical protein [Chamaesiphon sp. OTE_75_metabat_556]